MHLRLCGFPAMAPALTEAASQAQNFKLPYTSPASAESAPISLLDEPKVKRIKLDHNLGIVKKGLEFEEGTESVRKRLLYTTRLKRLTNNNNNKNNNNNNHNKRREETRIGDGGGEEEAKEVARCMMSSGGEASEDSEVATMGMLKTMSKKMDLDVDLGVAKDGSGLSKTRIDEINERTLRLKKKTDYLMRVVLKLQGRQLEKQILAELGVLVEHHHTTLQLPSRRERLQQGLKAVIANSGGSVNNSDLKAEILQCEDVKNLSTAALVNLVRKLESTHGSPHRQKYVTLQHLRSVDKVENASTGVKLPVQLCKEMERVGSTLRGNVRHLEKAIDSDATESSSGGESCDELEGYDEKRPHTVPINKRASWKWAMERSAVASRWTWLQAQVSDLEYRIRQQNDTYRKLRATKRPVQLEPQPNTNELSNCQTKIASSTQNPSRLGQATLTVNPTPERRIDSTLSSLLSSADSKSLPTLPGASLTNSRVNGFVGTSKNSSTSESQVVANGDVDAEDSIDASGATCTSSRTRALKPFRKRKLVHTDGLFRRSEKASKLSTVRCNCMSVSMAPCVMCGGRVNNTMNLEADAMPLEERVALLDPSFHSVLSFEQDVVTHLRFEALINSGDWHRVGQKQKVTTAARKRGHLGVASSDDVHKRSRKLKKNATATLTAKLKKKLNGEKRPRGRSGSMPLNKVGRGDRIQKKRPFSHVSLAMKKQRERNLSGSSGSSSKPGSPVPSLGDNSMGSSVDHKEHPRKSSIMQDLIRRRRGESAFDINNIVIPYSIAAATRVERLEYKEILTPKWRLADECEKEEPIVVVPNDNGLVTVKSEDEPVEDLSDELFDVRHSKCEREEKKRYLGYVKTPHHPHLGGRGRPRNMRTDSRCDSSGANTPDAMSPYPVEQHESPIATPPSTPAPMASASVESAENLMNSTRRRTASLTKRDRSSEDFRSASPEFEDPVSPWEKRTFPLNDIEVEDMVKISVQTPPSSPPRRRSSTEEQLLPPPPPPQTTTTPTVASTTPTVASTTTAAAPAAATTTTTSTMVVEKEPTTAIVGETAVPSAVVAAAAVSASSRPATPTSSSSTSLIGDDPNDPEWTVSTMGGERGPRPGIVIKLAKR